jgi:NAD(P)-dependent dehydrogenase (short-subunit alcohol dehydrogenase family)
MNNSFNMDFTGKVALVTGASSGIGYATAELLSSLGAFVTITGRNEDNLKKLARICRTKTLIVVGDITSEEDRVKVVDQTIETFGKLDILINSAGVIQSGSIETTTLAQYDYIMDTNVKAVYHMTMLCVPHLTKTKGNIVNVSSVNGIRSFPNVLAYCISKAAIDQLTKCTAVELASKKVRVNAVNPGVVITEIHKRSGMTEEQYNQFLERATETHALGRPGEPSEIASAIAFLASDLSAFTTGTLFSIDGGRAAMCPR